MSPQWLAALTDPARLTGRADVLLQPTLVPKAPGMYAWYLRRFRGMPDVSNCLQRDGLSLMYVGIAPQGAASKQTLRSRIQKHVLGDASRSTLRLSLGCLLADRLGIRLQQTPSGRYTFGSGEALLSDWMDKNAFVAWVEIADPWNYEETAIDLLDLPLNLVHNSHHPFASQLKAIRSAAKAAEKTDGGQQ